MTQTSAETAVHNLLMHCAGAQAGQRVLIAYEPETFGYFDAEVVDSVAREATKLGLHVDRTNVGFEAQDPRFSPDLMEQMRAADVVVFLARLGDQLRFSEMPDTTTIVNSYTLTSELLNSGFATAHYQAFCELKAAVDRVVAQADEIELTCPAGTSVRGRPDLGNIPSSDTTLRRFPVSVFSPVPAEGFSGKVALGGFLTGTGSRYYDDYTVEFDSQVFALLNHGRLDGFEGASADVAKAEAQYDRVSAMFGIDRNFVHSWHAGIHPGCGFPWDMRRDYDRWGGAAFGNPRILHFHTCGAYAPGEISWNLFDATIEVDGVALWEQGVFRADRLPEGREILARYPCAAQVFAAPDRNIGLSGTS